MLLGAQLADDRAEDTGADRLLVVVDQHGRVRIEADRRSVGTVDVLRGPDDHRLVDVALLDAPARRRLLDRDDDDVAHAREAALGAAQHLDALDALGAAIVGDFEVGLHLDHRSNSFFTLPRRKPGSNLLQTGSRPSPGCLRRLTPPPAPSPSSSSAWPCSPASPRPGAWERWRRRCRARARS